MRGELPVTDFERSNKNNWALSYNIGEADGENSAGGKGFGGNEPRRALTIQRQERWADGRKNIILDYCSALETKTAFFGC